MKKIVIIVIICLLVISSLVHVSAISQQEIQDRATMQKYGKAILNNLPNDKKNPIEIAQWGYTQYCNKLTEAGSPINNGAIGRIGYTVTSFEGDRWTCGYHKMALENLFEGMGLDPKTFRAIEGQSGGIPTPNSNHGALGVYYNGKVYMFDPWQQATFDGSYKSPESSPWNGMDMEDWVVDLKSKGYSTYSVDGQTPSSDIIEAYDSAAKKLKYSPLNPSGGTSDVQSALQTQKNKISTLTAQIQNLCPVEEKDEFIRMIEGFQTIYGDLEAEITSNLEKDESTSDVGGSPEKELMDSVADLETDLKSLDAEIRLVSCPACPNGMVMNKDTGECECTTGYFKNKKGECQLLCPEGSEPDTDGSCPTVCNAGYFYNKKSGECESICDETMQTFNPATGSCIDKLCPDGYPVPPGGCLPTCGNDEYYDHTAEKCVKKCTTGGLVYDKATDGCVPPDCGPKKYWNANAGRCECKSEYDEDEYGNCVSPQVTVQPTSKPTYTAQSAQTNTVVPISTYSPGQGTSESKTQVSSKGGMIQGLSSIEIFGIVLNYDSADRLYHGTKDGDSIEFDSSTFIITDTTTGEEEEVGDNDILTTDSGQSTVQSDSSNKNPTRTMDYACGAPAIKILCMELKKSDPAGYTRQGCNGCEEKSDIRGVN